VRRVGISTDEQIEEEGEVEVERKVITYCEDQEDVIGWRRGSAPVQQKIVSGIGARDRHHSAPLEEQPAPSGLYHHRQPRLPQHHHEEQEHPQHRHSTHRLETSRGFLEEQAREEGRIECAAAAQPVDRSQSVRKKYGFGSRSSGQQSRGEEKAAEPKGESGRGEAFHEGEEEEEVDEMAYEMASVVRSSFAQETSGIRLRHRIPEARDIRKWHPREI